MIENKDGHWSVGQIVGHEREVLNSVSCAFFNHRVQNPAIHMSELSLPLDDPIAVLFVTRDLLDRGIWRIVGNCPVKILKELKPYESLRDKGFVGAKIIGSAIVGEFLNAFFALVPWDDWKDPLYLDSLLISPSKKPKRLIYKDKVNNLSHS